MENYAIYLRKSRTDPDSNIDETLRRHKEILLEFAVKNELNITDMFEEVVSGESLYARPQMLKLLENVDNRHYTGVLCMDIDRLGRGGMSDQGIILETFKQSDTLIITPSKIYNLNDENDENNIEFKAFFARFEYKQINKRLKAGTKKSIQDGCFLACAPFGYRNVTVNKKPTLEIYEPEAKIVRMIFDMYANKGMGCQSIASAVNAMGITPHRSDEFGRTSIMSMLKNYVYIGKIVWDKKSYIRKNTKNNAKHITIYNPKEKWTITDGLHKPIIDKETWKKTQEIIQQRYHPPSFVGNIKNPLSGLVFCKNCGTLMKRSSPNKRKPSDVPHLHCERKGCMPSSKMEYVEQTVINTLEDKVRRIELNINNNKQSDTSIDFSIQIKQINDNIKELQKQKNKLHDFLEREVYDIDTFLERQKILKEREDKLCTQLEHFEEERKKARKPNDLALKRELKNVINSYWQSEPSERNILLKSVVEKIVYYKEKGWKSAEFSLDVTFKKFYE